MKIFQCTQNTPEWMELRCGVVTASEFGKIMTLNFDLRMGDGYQTYLYQKLAEHLTGPLPHYAGAATDQGHFLEPESIPYFELETGLDTHKVGFILSDDGRSGCSPDALIGDDEGLEVKCPGAVNAVRYLYEKELPSAYVAQVYGSLYVSGRKRWHFLSYHRKLPALHLVIERDEAIMEKIGKCIDRFTADFDKALDRLKPHDLQKAA